METDYFSSLGEVANIREYGRGILVQTIYCMPQTTEPLIVGILEKPDNKFELTDFSFATEFVQNSRYDYSGIPEKICEIAKKYNVQWVDEALTCTCEESELKERWWDVLEAMKEVILLYD
jgi:hypothetical protein